MTTTLKPINFNLEEYIACLNRQARNHEKEGNSFLAAYYKAAAKNKAQALDELNTYFDTRGEVCLDTRTLKTGRCRTVSRTREKIVGQFEEYLDYGETRIIPVIEEYEEEYEERFGESLCPDEFRDMWNEYVNEYN